MQDADNPERVKTFIADHIDSVVQLEILLLLQRNPSRDFAAQEIARELRIEPSWVVSRLADLSARGILVACGDQNAFVRFQPRSDELRTSIEELAGMYLSHRVRITSLIFAKPPEALKSFADAFRLRKDRKDG
ncbi:MAG TPA: hypothetical protein VH370_25315 [Humisphaera sp.]|nr:hypothetical protein [Humisphaera sp.]